MCFLSLCYQGVRIPQLPDNMYAEQPSLSFSRRCGQAETRLQDRGKYCGPELPLSHTITAPLMCIGEIAKDSSFNYVINEGNILTDSTQRLYS